MKNKLGQILNDFENYKEIYNDIDDMEIVINNYFSDLFYEIEDEEDLDIINNAEQMIREQYGVE